MRTDRPGYQYRRNKDGTTVHYWNPKRAVKERPQHFQRSAWLTIFATRRFRRNARGSPTSYALN